MKHTIKVVLEAVIIMVETVVTNEQEKKKLIEMITRLKEQVK